MAQMTVDYFTNASLTEMRTYDERAFAFISADDTKEEIFNAAAAMGVSSAAIAGIMAKEHDLYVNNPKNFFSDSYVRFKNLTGGDSYWRNEYELVKAIGIEDSGDPDDKSNHPILVDVGPANFKITTAIRLLEGYFGQHDSTGADPLELAVYWNVEGGEPNYSLLIGNMVNGEPHLTAALYALMLREGQDWFQTTAFTWWNSLPKAYQDGLLVTYASLGRTAVLNAFNDRPAGEPYEPEVGDGTSGGVKHLVNAARIGAIFGMSSYADGVSAMAVPSELIAAALENSLTADAYRYALVELDPTTLIGRDYSHFNQNGELDVFNEQTEEGTLTEKWITDRAEMLYEYTRAELSNLNKSSLDLSFRFEDRTDRTRSVGLETDAKRVFGSASGETIIGGLHDDHLYGGGGVDVILAAEGNDYIEGNDGGDDIRGGAGEDEIWGGTGIDTIDGGPDKDTIYGGKDGDRIKGDAGNDIIYADAKDETSTAIVGDDTVDGDAGEDEIHGGGGNDTLNGGADNDKLYGNANDDTIHGDGENDIIDGGTGADKLYGDDGNDELTGGEGDFDDLLVGGKGDDSVLDGGEGNDTIYGDEASESGGTEDGVDVLTGGIGNDKLYGGPGSDRLDGGEGNDLIYGGKGTDLLNGGAGDDTYVYNTGDGGQEVILDVAEGGLKRGRIQFDGRTLSGGNHKRGQALHRA